MYPLVGPPRSSGLYFIKNKKTGQIYAGQTVDLLRRFYDWRHIIATGLRMPSHTLAAAIKASDHKDWEFIVVMECPLDDLRQAEESLIAKLVARLGPLCLNVPDAGVRKYKPVQTGSVPLSEVRDENGMLLSYAEVAERLGTTLKSVQRRLANLRRAGRFKFDIGDLPARQKRLPQKSPD